VDVHSLCYVNDELDVGVVVVVGSARNLNVLVCHSDVVCVCLQIFWRGHDGELDGALVAERLVCPFSDGSDLLDGSDTVVCNEDLLGEAWSAAYSRSNDEAKFVGMRRNGALKAREAS
jgi:hypothetical protein